MVNTPSTQEHQHRTKKPSEFWKSPFLIKAGTKWLLLQFSEVLVIFSRPSAQLSLCPSRGPSNVTFWSHPSAALPCEWELRCFVLDHSDRVWFLLGCRTHYRMTSTLSQCLFPSYSPSHHMQPYGGLPPSGPNCSPSPPQRDISIFLEAVRITYPDQYSLWLSL